MGQAKALWHKDSAHSPRKGYRVRPREPIEVSLQHPAYSEPIRLTLCLRDALIRPASMRATLGNWLSVEIQARRFCSTTNRPMK